MHAFVPVENSECLLNFLLLAFLLPAQVHDLLEEIVVETRPFVVFIVDLDQSFFLLTLGDPVEAKVVDDALKVASVNQLIAMGEVFEGISEI